MDVRCRKCGIIEISTAEHRWLQKYRHLKIDTNLIRWFMDKNTHNITRWCPNCHPNAFAIVSFGADSLEI